MQLIPVMDLLAGQVVRAFAGERASYRPICTPLATSAEPADVVRGLLSLARFSSIYIADLDAITRSGSRQHFDLLAALCDELNSLGVAELWLDAGAAPWLEEFAALATSRGVKLVAVLGSESLADAETLAARQLSLPDCVLSLDYRGGKFLGPAGLDQQPAKWPRRVIAMDLAAVGVAAGPALARLQQIETTAQEGGRADIALYAAGGVRDGDDLRTLAARHVRGVLLASALHDARLDASSLREFTA